MKHWKIFVLVGFVSWIGAYYKTTYDKMQAFGPQVHAQLAAMQSQLSSEPELRLDSVPVVVKPQHLEASRKVTLDQRREMGFAEGIKDPGFEKTVEIKSKADKLLANIEKDKTKLNPTEKLALALFHSPAFQITPWTPFGDIRFVMEHGNAMAELRRSNLGDPRISQHIIFKETSDALEFDVFPVQSDVGDKINVYIQKLGGVDEKILFYSKTIPPNSGKIHIRATSLKKMFKTLYPYDTGLPRAMMDVSIEFAGEKPNQSNVLIDNVKEV